MPKLGVNIDHIATLRQARREEDPDPIAAAKICQSAGVDSIVAHLREDRRHIQDKDIQNLKKELSIPLNLEMSIADDIVDIACDLVPKQATLVPEKREEITTEGGLDIVLNADAIARAVKRLKAKGVLVSLFVDPEKDQIDKTKEIDADMIEIHTGQYDRGISEKEFDKIADMTNYANKLGLIVAAGHGLKYHNTRKIAEIPNMSELNIGHSIISRSVFVGLENAVKEMIDLVHI